SDRRDKHATGKALAQIVLIGTIATTGFAQETWKKSRRERGGNKRRKVYREVSFNGPLSSGRIFNLFCHNAMRAEKCYPNSWCFSRSRPRIPINRCCLDDSRVRTVCCGWCLVFPFLGYRLTTSRMPSNSESSRRREISSPARRTRRHITDRRSWAILQYNP